MLQVTQFRNNLIGLRACNALKAEVYTKHARLSNATNKQFESGQIINFIQVDAERLYSLFWNFSELVQVPVVLSVSFTFAFYIYGVDFFVAMAIFLFAVVVMGV